MQELHDVQAAMGALQGQIDSFAAAVNVAQQQQRADELEAIMSAPAFWDDQAAAQQVIAEMKGLKNLLEPYQALSSDLAGVAELAEMASSDSEAEAELLPELIPEMIRLQDDFR